MFHCWRQLSFRFRLSPGADADLSLLLLLLSDCSCRLYFSSMAILRLTSDAPTEYLRWPPSAAIATGVAAGIVITAGMASAGRARPCMHARCRPMTGVHVAWALGVAPITVH